jgi:hypothetical protein
MGLLLGGTTAGRAGAGEHFQLADGTSDREEWTKFAGRTCLWLGAAGGDFESAWRILPGPVQEPHGLGARAVLQPAQSARTDRMWQAFFLAITVMALLGVCF